MVSLLQESANLLFRFLIRALTEVVEADAPRGIDKVISGPVLIVKSTPDAIVVIHRHGIGDAEILHRFADVRFIFFKGKLWGMNADNYQAAVLVFLIPGPDIRQRAQAIDAGIGPEIDQNHFATKRSRGERRRVNPGSSSGKIGKDRRRGLRGAAGDANRLIDYDFFCGGMEA